MTPAAILIVLSARPKSMAEIEDAFRAYGRRLPGPAIHCREPRRRHQAGPQPGPAVAQAVEAGWVARHQDGDRFTLAGTGRAEASRMLEDLRSRRRRVHRLLLPSTAATATATLAAQIAITMIRIHAPAAHGHGPPGPAISPAVGRCPLCPPRGTGGAEPAGQ